MGFKMFNIGDIAILLDKSQYLLHSTQYTWRCWL